MLKSQISFLSLKIGSARPVEIRGRLRPPVRAGARQAPDQRPCQERIPAQDLVPDEPSGGKAFSASSAQHRLRTKSQTK